MSGPTHTAAGSDLPRPAYRIETERLLIRCWDPADGPQLRAALDELDSYLRPWIPWMRAEPQPLEHTVARLRGYRAGFDLDRDYRYGVFAASGSELVGETGLYPRVGPNAREIGYWIHARHAGRGLASEAAAAMVRVGFEVDRVERLEIHCVPDNEASNVIPRKLGFTLEATLARRATDAEDQPQDLAIWTLFAQDYAASPARHVSIAAYDCTGQRLC